MGWDGGRGWMWRGRGVDVDVGGRRDVNKAWTAGRQNIDNVSQTKIVTVLSSTVQIDEKMLRRKHYVNNRHIQVTVNKKCTYIKETNNRHCKKHLVHNYVQAQNSQVTINFYFTRTLKFNHSKQSSLNTNK